MNVLKLPTQIYHQVLELYRIRSEEERRRRIVAGVIVLVALAIIYYFLP